MNKEIRTIVLGMDSKALDKAMDGQLPEELLELLSKDLDVPVSELHDSWNDYISHKKDSDAPYLDVIEAMQNEKMETAMNKLAASICVYIITSCIDAKAFMNRLTERVLDGVDHELNG